MTERELQSAVIELARVLGWLVYHTHDSRRSEPGFPDLVLVRRERVIFAELKTAKGRTSAAQDAWLDALGQTGAEVRLWRPVHWAEGRIAADLQARTGERAA